MTKDLTGQRFGRLVVLDRIPPGEHRRTRWRCLCDCGREKVTDTNKLTSGNTRSCGCLRRGQMGNKALVLPKLWPPAHPGWLGHVGEACELKLYLFFELKQQTYEVYL